MTSPFSLSRLGILLFRERCHRISPRLSSARSLTLHAVVRFRLIVGALAGKQLLQFGPSRVVRRFRAGTGALLEVVPAIRAQPSTAGLAQALYRQRNQGILSHRFVKVQYVAFVFNECLRILRTVA